MTTPINDPTGTPPTAGTSRTGTGASTTTQAGTGLGKDAFLQLLVASMKYQDPSKPTDSQAYMAQLAQFTQVEKLESINTSQADLSRWQKTVAGQGMIGHSITGTSPTGDAVQGVVTGVTLTSTGPRLQLAGGGSLGVDDVTSVTGTPAS